MENHSHTQTRLYVPFWMGILLLVSFPVLAAVIGLGLFKLYARPTLYNPNQQFAALNSNEKTEKPPVPMQKVAESTAQSTTGNKLTIIFFYDGYTAQKDALDKINIMKEALKEVEPFKSMQDTLDFKVFTTDSKKCKPEQNSLVCDKALIESFRKLGVDHFKVVLMSPDYFFSNAPVSRGLNSFIAISTFNSNLQDKDEKRWIAIQFMQLLGKSLGLETEVVDAGKISPEPAAPGMKKTLESKRPNCALDRSTAEDWWGQYAKVVSTVGFYQGCAGDSNAYYPEQNTLMSDFPKKQSYGLVSEDYLRGVLSCFYAEKDSIVFPAGITATVSASLKSCATFTKDYPNFWKE